MAHVFWLPGHCAMLSSAVSCMSCVVVWILGSVFKQGRKCAPAAIGPLRFVFVFFSSPSRFAGGILVEAPNQFATVCSLRPQGLPLRASLMDPADVTSNQFQQEMYRLGRQLRATNMSLEGELAANKAAAPATRKAVGAERLAYVGPSHGMWGCIFSHSCHKGDN